MKGKMGKKMEKNDYFKRIQAADEEIKEKMKIMIGGHCEELSYQTSLIMSRLHKPQDAHIDYDPKTTNADRFMVAFLPLTKSGQFLQFWNNVDDVPNTTSSGEIVFIPKGQLVLVPGNTIHGGGFRAELCSDTQPAHMRLHFYVYPNCTSCMVSMHKNHYKNTDIYVQNGELGNTTSVLNTTFFHGKWSL